MNRLDEKDPFRIPAAGEVISADDGFSFSDNYRSVFLRGFEPFILTPRQAAVVEMLRSAHRAKRPEMAWTEIAARLEAMGPGFHAGSMQDIFKKVPDWQKLIVSTRRGFYKLGI
ncbi:MAG TPA: hypothetical protein VJB57_19955 [Dehalococcoidia bacterium]|nr:hypothetical protein [Dehalococcoidia bacterium]